MGLKKKQRKNSKQFITRFIFKYKQIYFSRSPGGRPLRAAKRENSPCTDLQEILRKRYHAMTSPDSRNSSALNIDDSF